MAVGGRIVLAGTQSGVGKTTLALGIMGALKKKGLTVKPFKVGPDYIDPQFHSFVTSRPSRNLDSYLLDEKTLRGLFSKNTAIGDVAVIEGVMGLYDGFGTKSDVGSTAHVAKLLKSPVVLILDGGGISTSAAAIALGFKLFDPEVDIAGVIINQVSGEKHYQLLKGPIEEKTGLKCLGYLKRNANIQLESRHLGLVPTQEVEALREKLDMVIAAVEETIDLDGLLKLASEAEGLEATEVPTINLEEKINIAYAFDKAFSFYYQDNLDLLREAGVNLIPFSPMVDTTLPLELHGIYIGGGFPEVFAQELESNKGMREAILMLAEGGIPIYAECGGYMYLTKAIKDLQGNSYDMVGVYDSVATMTGRLQRFGYNQTNLLDNKLIPNDVGEIKGHEFHRAIVEPADNSPAYSVKKLRDGEVIDAWCCGEVKYNCIAGFPHFHFYSNSKFIEAFLQGCINFKKLSKTNNPTLVKNRL